jgi:hypothetical protein
MAHDNQVRGDLSCGLNDLFRRLAILDFAGRNASNALQTPYAFVKHGLDYKSLILGDVSHRLHDKHALRRIDNRKEMNRRTARRRQHLGLSERLATIG